MPNFTLDLFLTLKQLCVLFSGFFDFCLNHFKLLFNICKVSSDLVGGAEDHDERGIDLTILQLGLLLQYAGAFFLEVLLLIEHALQKVHLESLGQQSHCTDQH